jgi:hypothetical protein
MIFISFYTSNGKYPELATKLKASLIRHELNYDIEQVDHVMTWEEACSFKSKFILNKLLQFRRSVVWMDIDTEVWKYPELLEGPHDFAIYNWHADKNHHLEDKIDIDPNSKHLFCSGGVQKWGYSAPAIELLLRWNNAVNSLDKSRGDDPILDLVYNTFNPPVHSLWLPKTYNRMDKHTLHWQTISNSDIVINHDYTAGRHGMIPL